MLCDLDFRANNQKYVIKKGKESMNSLFGDNLSSALETRQALIDTGVCAKPVQEKLESCDLEFIPRDEKYIVKKGKSSMTDLFGVDLSSALETRQTLIDAGVCAKPVQEKLESCDLEFIPRDEKYIVKKGKSSMTDLLGVDLSTALETRQTLIDAGVCAKPVQEKLESCDLEFIPRDEKYIVKKGNSSMTDLFGVELLTALETRQTLIDSKVCKQSSSLKEVVEIQQGLSTINKSKDATSIEVFDGKGQPKVANIQPSQEKRKGSAVIAK